VLRGLYAIVDTTLLTARGIDPLAFAEAVLAARPAALQLRAKNLGKEATLALLRALAPMCRSRGVPLVANDHPELVASAGCDLVHVGQEDAPVDRARLLARGAGVGVSTHAPDQLARALDARPAYVAYGPVFRTTSKERAEPVVGLEGLRQASELARAARIPLVAIGGIDLARAADVAPWVEMIAVIRALVPDAAAPQALAPVTEAARAFDRAMAR
jgi:thiamine-phosphate pyrophosphorylase